MPRNLYYIDSIYQREGSDPAEGYITLISTDADVEGRFIPITIPFNRMPMVTEANGNRRSAEEDTYAYLKEFKQGNEIILEDGNNDPYAVQQFETKASLRQRLDEAYGNEIDQLTEEECLILAHPTEIFSYHVNVGHGNCSLILIKSGYKYILWMVDGSTIEAGGYAAGWTDHSNSLYNCLEDIAVRVEKQICNLQINRFFLTHPHYDHYNGVFYLHHIGLLNNKTVYYINYYYDSSNEAYRNFLQQLYDNKIKIIEPTSQTSLNSFVRILHPECRIFRTGKLLSSAMLPYREVGKVNNASVVYCFQIGNFSMVFPGDLQHEGFDAMTKVSGCCHMFEAPDYYSISHHGSGNGHPRQRCLTNHIPYYPLGCLTDNLKKAILMGRDGVYSTMFDPNVVSYFNKNNKLVTTDMKRGKDESLKYLTLDWHNGNVEYYF